MCKKYMSFNTLLFRPGFCHISPPDLELLRTLSTAIMDAFTPAQTTELVSRMGAKKARMRIDKMFLNSFMGGPLLGFGCALLLSTNSAPWFQTNAPGLIRSIAAAFFPVGLMMVMLTGADLFTSYVLVRTLICIGGSG
jgi:formate/nitrite transporter FocA (FNT family)